MDFFLVVDASEVVVAPTAATVDSPAHALRVRELEARLVQIRVQAAAAEARAAAAEARIAAAETQAKEASARAAVAETEASIATGRVSEVEARASQVASLLSSRWAVIPYAPSVSVLVEDAPVEGEVGVTFDWPSDSSPGEWPAQPPSDGMFFFFL